MATAESRARNTELEKGARHTVIAASNCTCLCGVINTVLACEESMVECEMEYVFVQSGDMTHVSQCTSY